MIKKMLLMIFGVFISFIILEFVLQISGFALTSIKNYHNKKIKNSDQITVLCLGESTTEKQWPPILQQILNRKYGDKKFNIIDEGKPGTQSNLIATKIDKYLMEYDPDIVIAMIGINDAGNLGFFVKKIKTISLFELIYKHIKFKYFSDERIYNEKYGMAIDCIHGTKDYKKAEEILLDLIKEFKLSQDIFNVLSEVYVSSGNMIKMENLFNNHNSLTIDNILQFEEIYLKFYDEDSFKKWLINNKHKFFLDTRNFRTQKFLERYKFVDIEKTQVGDKQNEQNHEIVKPQDDAVKKILRENYLNIINKIYEHNQKIIVFVMQYPMLATDDLKNMLKDSKCYEKLVFISNENNFKEALKTYKEKDVFIDMFAGTFGHCTDFGNTLIAENLAENIERLPQYSVKK